MVTDDREHDEQIQDEAKRIVDKFEDACRDLSAFYGGTIPPERFLAAIELITDRVVELERERIFKDQDPGLPPQSRVPPLKSTDEIFGPALGALNTAREFEDTQRAANALVARAMTPPDGVRLAEAVADPGRCGVCGSRLVEGVCSGERLRFEREYLRFDPPEGWRR